MAKVPVADVLCAGDLWFKDTGRQITYEYVVLGGLNDSREHSERLAARLRGRRCTVNLIPYNPTPELPFYRPEGGSPEYFRDVLVDGGLTATIRWSRGLEGAAACGQLRLVR